MDELVPIFIAIAPKDIVFFNFIVESYEGLGEVRTICPEKGQLVVLTLPDMETAVRELVASIQSEISIRIIPKPAEIENDWLLDNLVGVYVFQNPAVRTCLWGGIDPRFKYREKD